MIELYEMVSVKYNEDSCIKPELKFVNREVKQTRGNKLKIYFRNMFIIISVNISPLIELLTAILSPIGSPINRLL